MLNNLGTGNNKMEELKTTVTEQDISNGKPTFYLDYENLPTPSEVEVHNLAGHRFTEIENIPIDMLRCIDCGKQTALNTLLTVVVEGFFKYEQCKSYENYMEFCQLEPKQQTTPVESK